MWSIRRLPEQGSPHVSFHVFSATAAERSSGNVSRRATVLSAVVYVQISLI